MSALLKQLNSSWRARSRREQVLALCVAALCSLMGMFWIVTGALDNLRRLDTQIQQLQDDIVNYNFQIARKQSVEAHYSAVASQHSSAWTQPEIQERLRQEIYRLAQKVPPALNDEGIPTTTVSDQGNLVEIPALGEGNLSEGDEDYRQYSISFRVPAAEYSSMFAFLERLQNSPQSLRIDGLELTRAPESTLVAANIDLARIIVAGTAGTANDTGDDVVLVEGGPIPLSPADWQCEGCQVALVPEFATTGTEALQAIAASDGAVFYTIRSLPAGATYDMTVDITASGAARMEIVDDGTGQAFEGSGEPLRDDGEPYRYTTRFTVPGESGQTRLRLPAIRIDGQGARVVLDNLSLTQLARS